MNRPLLVGALLLAVTVSVLFAVSRRRGPASEVGGPRPGTPAAVSFTDVTDAAGITWKHHNGAVGNKFMPETVGGGVSFLDYDGDGRLDVLFVNSSDWPGTKNRQPRRPALYHNEGNGRFRDATNEAGLGGLDVYGMGATVGDYDNDGDSDVFLTCLGPNFLFRNDGGKFTDVTAKAGVRGVPVDVGGIRWKWSSSAAFCDYDRDGVPDLFVCQYVKWTPETDVFCSTRGDKKAYCAPTNFEGVPSTLYRGRGDGTFEDVSDATGIRRESGKSFGVIAADFNGDSWVDFAVTNDTTRNFLFLSEEGKRFREAGRETGFAFSETGKAKAGMGIDAADWNNDGRLGLLTGNFSRETLSLFSNDGTGLLTEKAHASGVAAPSLLFLTFGLFFFDMDLDGRQDIFAANGHIDDYVQSSDAMITYKERALLYRNLGGGRFEEIGEKAGPALAIKLVGRGCARGDFDGDGDPDVAVVSNDGRGYLWRNDTPHGKGWVGLKLRGTRPGSTRDAWHAVARVTAGGLTQTYPLYGGGSFISQHQTWPLFGLNGAERAERVEIDWPDGAKTRLENLAGGSYYEVVEGDAAPHPVPTQ